MSPHSPEARTVYALAVACLIVTSSAAQTTRAAGPFAGLFGGGKNAERTLDLRGTAFGAYDWGPPADSGPTGPADPTSLIDPVLAETGVVRGIDGAINYSQQGSRIRFGLEGQGAFEQYPAAVLRGGTYSVNSDVNVNLTNRLTVDARGGYSRSAFYQFAPSLGSNPISSIPLTPGYEFAAVALPNTTLDGGLSVTSDLTKRSSVGGGVRTARTRFPSPGSIDNFDEWAADVSFTHHITRPLIFQLGYERDHLREGGSTLSPVVIQSIDVGLDYSEDLSVARRFTLSFSAAPSMVRYEGQTNYRLDGRARLTRALARTWTAAIEYTRETTFIPGFAKPLFVDAVEGSVGGLIQPRVEWSGIAEYSRGQIGVGGFEPFGVYGASSMLEFALVRNLGLFCQYSYYRYRVPQGSTDLPLLPVFSRHAVTVGMTAWVPLLNRKASRDSR